MRWALLFLLACRCSPAPEPLSAAEDVCRVRVFGVVDSGACDDFANLNDCPEYTLAMAECGALLRAAAEAE